MKSNVGTQEKMPVPIGTEEQTKSKLVIPYLEWRTYVNTGSLNFRDTLLGCMWSCPGCGKQTLLADGLNITEADCCGPACFAIAVLRWQAAREGQR